MLETELFTLLEQTADAAYTVTEGGEICPWNRAAERLFGYHASEMLGRSIDEVLDARDALNTDALAVGSEAATRRWDGTGGGIPDSDLEVRTRSGGRIWSSRSPSRSAASSSCLPRVATPRPSPAGSVFPPRHSATTCTTSTASSAPTTVSRP